VVPVDVFSCSVVESFKRIGALGAGSLAIRSSSASCLGGALLSGRGRRNIGASGGGVLRPLASSGASRNEGEILRIIHRDLSEGLTRVLRGGRGLRASGDESGGSGVEGVERGNGGDRGGNGDLCLLTDDVIEERGFLPVQRGRDRGLHVSEKVSQCLILVFQVTLGGSPPV
jgi:hypothetical protein